MENKVRLIEYHKLLCEVLNNAGIRDEWKGGLYDWLTDENDPYSTFLGGICSNDNAFKYLKMKGYLDKGICPSCGNTILDKNYTFHDTLYNPNCIFYICRNCYNIGKASSTRHL